MKRAIYAIIFTTLRLAAITYEQAGVNISAGNNLVECIKPLVQQTARLGADAALGGFGGLFDLAKLNYKDPLLISSTDGVGTKLKLAQAMGKHETIGIDLVAMCVNDLLVHGAEPLFFLDYFATSALDVELAQCVIAGIARGCQQAGCALIGGETAEMPGMYQPGEYDCAGFVVGIVERDQLLPQKDKIVPGDVVIGVASSGLHSNGFSLVRRILADNGVDLYAPPPFVSTHEQLCEALLEPTKIYIKSILPIVRAGYAKALAHITGGGLIENVPRVLPVQLGVEIDEDSWPIPPVFTWLAQTGNVPADDLWRTFNMGIGLVLIVAQEDVDVVHAMLAEAGEQSWVIGRVILRGNRPKKFAAVCVRS